MSKKINAKGKLPNESTDEGIGGRKPGYVMKRKEDVKMN